MKQCRQVRTPVLREDLVKSVHGPCSAGNGRLLSKPEIPTGVYECGEGRMMGGWHGAGWGGMTPSGSTESRSAGLA